MKFAIAIPEGRNALSGAAGSLPKHGKSANVPLKTWLSWVHNGTVRGYEHNRGDGSVATSTVNACRNDLDLDALGCLTVSESGVLADGHSRTLGLHLRWCEGKMTRSEMATPVTVRAVSDGAMLAVYRKTNSGKSHSVGDKLVNPDLGFGAIVKSIVDLVPGGCGVLGRSHFVNLANLAMAAIRFPRAFDFMLEYNDLRREVKGHINVEAGSLPHRLGEAGCRRVAAGVVYYLELREELAKHKVNLSTICKSGPLFGLVVADRMQPEPALASPKLLARRIVRNAVKLTELVPLLTHGSEAAARKTAALAVRLLGG
jgi:hypothetical protein